jgi:Rieske 2Fe-2S family protein
VDLRSGFVCVGRVEDLPAKGAWLRAPITPAGVLVVRGNDGELRAFHAVCTHRGSTILEGDEGIAERFTCPYHGATFDLRGAPCGSLGKELVETRIEIVHGFVFVSLDDREMDDDELPPWFARADLSRLRRARRVAYEVAADIQLVIENFQESLHFSSVHPALEAITPSARAETWMPERKGPWLGGIMPISDGAETVSRSMRRSGRPFIVPEEDRRVVHDAMRFPNLLTSLQPDYLLTFVLFPDGDRTRVIASTYVHEDATELDDVFAFWDRVYEEDRIACERQARGLASLPITPTYSDVEEGAAAAARMAQKRSPLCGIFGKPYVDLSPHVDISSFPELHREITLGLAQVETSYTGGTLKWMGVCAPWAERDPYVDAMHAIERMSAEELADFLALGEDTSVPDPLAFGDETDRPFTRAQMELLVTRHGVYFPWKCCYHLLENDRWDDKHSGDGKDFGDEARRVFPKTVAFVESLPMREIGRVVVFGLSPNDHAPAHRDSEPGKALSIAQSISFHPGGRKRFFLQSRDGDQEVVVDAPIYWFNDMDWHGVHADPWFRYSIRVDGMFDEDFLVSLRRAEGR